MTTTAPNGGDSSVSVFVTLIKLLPALKIVLNINMEKTFQNIGDDIIRELGQILAYLEGFPAAYSFCKFPQGIGLHKI